MWMILRRMLAAVGLIVAVAGIIAFAGAAIGVWQLKAEANRRTDDLAVKAHIAIDAADHTVGFVGEVITQGERDLQNVRSAARSEPQRPVNPLLQLSARQASQQLAGSVERASAAVVAASDTVEVARTALKLFDEDEQLKSWFPVHPGQLAQTQTDLGAASRELKNVKTILGVPVSEGGAPTDEQLVTVEAALKQARGFTDQMGRVVAKTREKVVETKRTVDLWTLRVALGVTALGALGAAGQFFMARFFWRVLRGKPA